MLSNTLLAILAAALHVTAAPAAIDQSLTPLEARQQGQVVPHNSIAFIPEKVRDGPEGSAIFKYEPFLHIAHGCRSYPAVSKTGQLSGGLQNSGGASSGCNDGSNGQTYARGSWHRGRYAIMYAWYFPKDQITSGGANGGHRHDWESVVIWIDNPANANPVVFGAAASGHGGFKKTRGLPQHRNGLRLQVEYFTNFPFNHELQFKTSPGNDHAMIDYAAMDPVTRDALDGHLWGKANCPFSRNNFISHLDKAWID